MTTEEDVYAALKYHIELGRNGTRKYYNHAWQLHCEDGPAVVRTGESHWFLNGRRHRENGPAIEYINGHTEWWLNGVKHRIDGPAVEYHGGKEWWLNGQRHREDGPAIVHTNGSMEWWQNGKLHREDGPAYETKHGVNEWFLFGVEYTEQEFTAVRQARGYDAD